MVGYAYDVPDQHRGRPRLGGLGSLRHRGQDRRMTPRPRRRARCCGRYRGTLPCSPCIAKPGTRRCTNWWCPRAPAPNSRRTPSADFLKFVGRGQVEAHGYKMSAGHLSSNAAPAAGGRQNRAHRAVQFQTLLDARRSAGRRAGRANGVGRRVQRWTFDLHRAARAVRIEARVGQGSRGSHRH